MNEVVIVKIHDGPGHSFVLVSSDRPCDEIYQLIDKQFGDQMVLIDISRVPNPVEVVQGQIDSTDVLFCMSALGFFPSTRDDVRQWFIKQDHSMDLLRPFGDIWVIADLGEVHEPLTDIEDKQYGKPDNDSGSF